VTGQKKALLPRRLRAAVEMVDGAQASLIEENSEALHGQSERGSRVGMGNRLGSEPEDKVATTWGPHRGLLPVCRPVGEGMWKKMTDMWAPHA
jgi:hypothetical protein